MKLSSFIAFRYLFSKKSTNAINIVSAISALGFFVGCLALIIVLSAMNGLESLVSSLVNQFNADLQVTAVKQKTFVPTKKHYDALVNLETVKGFSQSLEENAFATFKDGQEIIRLKGVDDNFNQLKNFDTCIISGSYYLDNNKEHFALVGAGVASRLRISPEFFAGVLKIYVPNSIKYNALNPEQSLNFLNLQPTGIFSVQEEIDNKYIILPYQKVEKLLNKKGHVSSLEIMLKPKVNINKVKFEVKNIFGSDFKVLDKYEQNESIYKVFRTEKWASFVLLSFILLVAAVNVIGSLILLALDKRKDINILNNLGLEARRIRLIFLKEGLLIALLGGGLGLFLGVVLVWLQKNVGIIRLQNSIVEFYPVALKLGDVLLVLLVLLIMGIITSWFPAQRAAKMVSNNSFNE